MLESPLPLVASETNRAGQKGSIWFKQAFLIWLINRSLWIVPIIISLSSHSTFIILSSKIANITKTCLYNFDPLKPHFYTVKLRFTGVYIIFIIFAQNKDCGYSLEPPRRGGSKEYPQSMFWAEIWKISGFFLSENFQFLEVKFSIYLNRLVFVMSFKNRVWLSINISNQK